MDVLDSKIKQGKENDDCFLLIPCDIVGDRELVDIVKAKNFLELEGYDRKRIRIVALACVKDSWYSSDVSQIEFIVAVLGTFCCKYDRVLRKETGKRGVVFS